MVGLFFVPHDPSRVHRRKMLAGSAFSLSPTPTQMTAHYFFVSNSLAITYVFTSLPNGRSDVWIFAHFRRNILKKFLLMALGSWHHNLNVVCMLGHDRQFSACPVRRVNNNLPIS